MDTHLANYLNEEGRKQRNKPGDKEARYKLTYGTDFSKNPFAQKYKAKLKEKSRLRGQSKGRALEKAKKKEVLPRSRQLKGWPKHM